MSRALLLVVSLFVGSLALAQNAVNCRAFDVSGEDQTVNPGPVESGDTSETVHPGLFLRLSSDGHGGVKATVFRTYPHSPEIDNGGDADSTVYPCADDQVTLP